MKIPYFQPWISSEDKKAVLDTLNQQWLTNGPILKKFEKKFGQYIDVKHSAGVGSATHALHLSMRALGIGERPGRCRLFRTRPKASRKSLIMIPSTD